MTVVRSGGLGDTILLLPALQWLRARLPGARLTLVGSAWAEALQPLVPFALETARFDSPRLAALFAETTPSDAPPVLAGAHAVVVYAADVGSAFVRNVTQVAAGAVLAWPVHPAVGRHAAAHFVDALTASRLSLDALPAPRLVVPKSGSTWARAWLAERLGQRAAPVAMHPGSGGQWKCWPASRFAEVAVRLPSPALLIEGPADEAACAEFRRRLDRDRPVAIARGLTLDEVAALIAQSVGYVGNDSGISHLAAALGVPTVAIFGPTDPAVWGPLGPYVRTAGGPPGPWPDLESVLLDVRRLFPAGAGGSCGDESAATGRIS